MAEVNTKHVPRRDVKLKDLDELLREAMRLAQAEHDGQLDREGNWSAGTIFGHLAAWIDYPYDGFPPNMKPPLILRLLMRFAKPWVINGRMPRGIRIPKVKGGTFGIERLSTAAGLAKLQRSVERLKRQTPTRPSPLFGQLTHAQWIRLHLRHAELHFGYLTVR